VRVSRLGSDRSKIFDLIFKLMHFDARDQGHGQPLTADNNLG
jgi:hypothetical protein